MSTHPHRTTNKLISRRCSLSSCGLATLGLLSASAFGQTQKKETDAKKPAPQASREAGQTTGKSQAVTERLRNADSTEERWQIMNEQMASQRQRAFEDLKGQLGISDQEWPVVRPRLQAVYDLVRPVRQMGRNEQPKTEVEQMSRDLRELLRDDKADVAQIKAKLTSLRAAKERAAQELSRARQNLRQIMSVRQEALLVLNGLLD